MGCVVHASGDLGMMKADVLAHFGGNYSEVARALQDASKNAYGTRQGVHKWPEVVPEVSAYFLDKATDGALVFDADFYQERRLQKRNRA